MKLFYYKNKLFLLFLTAFITRFIYSIFHINHFGVDITNDASEYIRFGQMMINEGWMVRDLATLNSTVGPGYGLVFALNELLFQNNNFIFPVFLNILLGSMMVVLVYQIGILIFNNQKAALISGLWAVFYLQFIRYSPLINKESIVFFLFTLSVFIVFKLKSKKHILQHKYLILFSLVYMVLVHTDERYIFHLPFFILFLLFPINSVSLKKSLTILTISFLLMLPWLYRNFVVYERPVILTERIAWFTDEIFAKGIPKDELVFSGLLKQSSYKRENLPLYEHFADSIQQGYSLKTKNFKYFSLMEDGIKNGHIPKTYTPLESKWHEFKELMRPIRLEGSYIGNGYRYMRKWKVESNIIYGLQYGLLLLFFFPGLISLKKRGLLKERVYFLLILIVIHISLHLFLNHGLQRYRIPIDFIFILIGSYGILLPIQLLLNKTFYAKIDQ